MQQEQAHLGSIRADFISRMGPGDNAEAYLHASILSPTPNGKLQLQSQSGAGPVLAGA